MSDISLFSSLAVPSLLSSPSSFFSPILSTGTGRSHNGPHGGFSSGYGGCCPPVFNPGTLFALISGIALATYFLRPVYSSSFSFVFVFCLCLCLFNISSLEFTHANFFLWQLPLLSIHLSPGSDVSIGVLVTYIFR